MKAIVAQDFQGERAWGALDIAAIEGATVRLHWTDRTYQWHVNDGPEVFVVLDGVVDMHYREEGQEKVVRMQPGAIFHAEEGEAHRAEPIGVARVLVIERAGSV
jgi:mannose-6-phosphate isomerase-like protein (cupin superfamily)